MIVEYIRYALKDHSADEFLGAYACAEEQLRASPHALNWELSRCAEDRSSFILRIEWDSASGHMEGFRRSPQFPAFFAAIKPFVGEIAEMRHYEPTAIAS